MEEIEWCLIVCVYNHWCDEMNLVFCSMHIPRLRHFTNAMCRRLPVCVFLLSVTAVELNHSIPPPLKSLPFIPIGRLLATVPLVLDC